VDRIDWQREAEVLVVGFGAAGATAAITAHDEGVQVLILEKQPEASHVSNSSLSGGVFICPTDVEAAVRYLEALYRVEGEYWTDPDVIRVWAEYCSQNKSWIEKLGGKVRLFSRGGEHHVIPGYETIELYMFRGSGYGLMRFLKGQVASRGIEVLYNCRARKLLTNLRGEVIGVRAETERGEINIRARRAVILTCGGFEFNEALKLNYLRVYPTYFYGSPANTGDGILMAQEVGAALWHMNCCSARLIAKYPDFPIGFSLDFGGRGWLLRRVKYGMESRAETCGYIVVDKYGRRYTNENFKVHSLYYELTLFDSQRADFPRVPSYWIFDRRRFESGPLPISIAGPTGPHRLYRWSRDNRAELEKGWIISGADIKELALKLNMDPEVLEGTVRRYNEFCRLGEDRDFGRPPSHLAPLDEPPFYAVRLWPGGPNTQGGPRRNCRAQVLNVDGVPIPRLYAAGELGSVYGMLYPSGGGNIAECLAFGRVAAENAVKEPPS